MSRELFITWLKLDCLVTGITGLVAFAGSIEALSGPWLWLFNLVTWPLNDDPARFSPETMSVNAMLGGVMVAWAILIYCVTVGPIAQGNIKLTRQMLLSILAWFCIDSLGSYLSNLPGNIILNLIFLNIFLVPLLVLSRQGTPNQKYA